MSRWQRFLLAWSGRAWMVVALAWGLAIAGDALHWWRFSRLSVPLVASLVGLGLLAVWVRWRRERLVREAPLPRFLKLKLRQAYPHLSFKDAELVERGLRQFFMACQRDKRFVAMPSRAVDAMWHEFILHTQAYHDWCALVLGRFLHHTPAEALGARATHNDGLRRAWFWCCRDEAINPRQPTRLPLLFALDTKLAIPDGFHYVPDCRDIADKSDAGHAGAGAFCGTDFAHGSASGDADGFGGADVSSSADGGGSDGSGCGGGGGGGGGGD